VKIAFAKCKKTERRKKEYPTPEVVPLKPAVILPLTLTGTTSNSTHSISVLPDEKSTSESVCLEEQETPNCEDETKPLLKRGMSF